MPIREFVCLAQASRELLIVFAEFGEHVLRFDIVRNQGSFVLLR